MAVIRPIRNEEDHAAALRRIEELWQAPDGSEEADELEVLATLVHGTNLLEGDGAGSLPGVGLRDRLIGRLAETKLNDRGKAKDLYQEVVTHEIDSKRVEEAQRRLTDLGAKK